MDQEFRDEEPVPFRLKMIKDDFDQGQITGYKPDYHTAKQLYKNSSLFPPPAKIEQKKNRQCKDRMDKLKYKLRAVFTRIRLDNAKVISNLKSNLSQQNLSYLEFQECTQFLQEYRHAANDKFYRLNKNSKSLMRQYSYKDAHQDFDSTQKWIEQLEQFMKQKYADRLKKKAQINQLKQKYFAYQSMLYQGGCHNQMRYNVEFSMNQLASEINRLMMLRQDKTAIQQIQAMQHQVGRQNKKKEKRDRSSQR